jgi:hypothetical protein
MALSVTHIVAPALTRSRNRLFYVLLTLIVLLATFAISR